MVDSTKGGWTPRYSAKATADSGWQTPSTSPSVSPASASASSTMATSRSRPKRSSSPVGETSSATPTMAAAPRRLRSTLLILDSPPALAPSLPRSGSGVLGQLREGRRAVVAGLLGESEHPFADDVALHLVGPTVDGRRLREQGHLGDAAGKGISRRLLQGGLAVDVV